MKVFIYSDDINLISYWEKTLDSKSVFVESKEELETLHSSFVITNTQALQNQAQEFLEGLVKNGNSVFLLDRTPSLQKAKKYLAYGIKGYGNALMHKELFLSALGVIKQGMIWFHPELLTQLLYEQTTPTDVEQSKLEPLSKREKEVALLIKDGCTYKQMADRLNVKPRTIKAHAQSIYTKLQVKDKLDLVLYLKG